MNAMYIIDGGARKIELFPDKAKYDERYVRVDHRLAESARRYNVPDYPYFTPEEAAIRDTFVRFLHYFERFEQLILAGLITKKELQPYLQYWVDSICDWLEEDTRESIFNFINEYRYTGTQRLFMRIGKSIMPKQNAIRS